MWGMKIPVLVLVGPVVLGAWLTMRSKAITPPEPKWSMCWSNENTNGPISVMLFQSNRITREYRIDYSTNLALRFNINQ